MMSARCLPWRSASFCSASFSSNSDCMNWLSARRDGDLVLADEGLEVGLHLARALVAIVGVLRERPHDDRLEVRGVVGVDVARARVLALADELERLVLALRP